ncbi:hypothetical protein BDV39DRAFT_170263 [Aspergillus sergii]|uniref:Uncharacterized protein n=1 Tax=Aspergillus sergii TaxID=1034303 RepID=A0A5N6XCK0_9EURO|nr:hypothetical protein BDV39DRAFT_170263 [Aspergillus sergii]
MTSDNLSQSGRTIVIPLLSRCRRLKLHFKFVATMSQGSYVDGLTLSCPLRQKKNNALDMYTYQG